MVRFAPALVRKTISYLSARGSAFFGPSDPVRPPTSSSRVGLAFSGLFLMASGVWIVTTSERLPPIVPLAFLGGGSVVLAFSMLRKLSLTKTNILTLFTHVFAVLAFYLLATRFLTLAYSTDTIVATYAGLLGVLQFQSPYLYSIKPFLEQFSLPPSYYTPRVDGSFEFTLNYPAFNFLSMAPFYLAGLHDLRDAILFFHIVSILLIFGLAPQRVKSISLAPFAFGFPLAVVYSWTDSVWAFLLLLGTVAWYRDRRLGLAFVGLAGATKQIALVVVPFLLIRLWHESSDPKPRQAIAGLASLLAGFLAPNLPFIILSPVAWWTGNVAAYLPGRAPQVAAGTGLSEMLFNVGISLPTYFYLGLMSAVAAGSIYIYHKRFTRYKHFAWAFPALILFFYYRPFPNYMIYWLVPLLPELLRNKPGGIHWNPVSIFQRANWHPSIRPSMLGIRRKMTSSALLVLLLATVLAGVSGAYISTVSDMRVSVQISRVLDNDSVGAATQVETVLTNLGSEPVSPRFFIRWYFLPFLWNADTTTVLLPGSTAQYLLTATDGRAAIPHGAQFKVLVFNSLDGNLAGQSQTQLASLATPRVENPHFRWWTLDSETGRKVPFGWQLAMVGSGETSGIRELDGLAGEGLQLELGYNSQIPGPHEITLSQELPFDSSSFRILVLVPPEADSRGGAMFAAKVTDGTHTVYFIFSPTASQKSVITYPENATIITPVDAETWTWVPLDAWSEWTEEDWSRPKSIEFSIVLRGGSGALSYGFVKEVGYSIMA